MVKYGFIDCSGKIVIELEYRNAESIKEGLAAVQKGRNDGYIDKQGNIIFPFELDMAGPFINGIAHVVKNGEFGIIDRFGNFKRNKINDDFRIIMD